MAVTQVMNSVADFQLVGIPPPDGQDDVSSHDEEMHSLVDTSSDAIVLIQGYVYSIHEMNSVPEKYEKVVVVPVAWREGVPFQSLDDSFCQIQQLVAERIIAVACKHELKRLLFAQCTGDSHSLRITRMEAVSADLLKYMEALLHDIPRRLSTPTRRLSLYNIDAFMILFRDRALREESEHHARASAHAARKAVDIVNPVGLVDRVKLIVDRKSGKE